MTKKREILSNNEAEELYQECFKYPELIEKLDRYEAKKIFNIGKSIHQRLSDQIADLVINAEYNYPDEYLPDKLFEYWADHSGKGKEMKKHENILELLKNRIYSSESIKDELNENEILAINTACLDAKEKDKKRVLTAYAKLIKTNVKADLQKRFESKFSTKKSTFYKWAKEYEDKLKSITHADS